MDLGKVNDLAERAKLSIRRELPGTVRGRDRAGEAAEALGPRLRAGGSPSGELPRPQQPHDCAHSPFHFPSLLGLPARSKHHRLIGLNNCTRRPRLWDRRLVDESSGEI